MTGLLQAQLAAAIVIGAAATIEDLRTRSVPNCYPVAALLAGCLLHTIHAGWRGAFTAAAGALAGFAVFLVFYILGGMGGADVKLMAGFGSIVGLQGLLSLAFWTALAGGLFALIVLAVAKCRPTPTGRPHSIPYAPALAVGVCLALVSA